MDSEFGQKTERKRDIFAVQDTGALQRRREAELRKKKTGGKPVVGQFPARFYLGRSYLIPSFFLMSFGIASLWTRMFMVL